MSNYCHKSVLFGMLGMLRDEQCGDDYDDDGQISAVWSLRHSAMDSCCSTNFSVVVAVFSSTEDHELLVLLLKLSTRCREFQQQHQ